MGLDFLISLFVSVGIFHSADLKPKQLFQTQIENLRGRTVEVTSAHPGLHGGLKLIVSRIENKNWSDWSDKHGKQGNPSQFAATLGETISNYFGFMVIEENNRVEIPNLNERYNAIAEYNRFLKNRIPSDFQEARILIQFYNAPEGEVTSETLVTRFSQYYGIPVGETGIYFHHDTNVHFGAILIPNSFLTLAQLQTRALLNFIKFCKKGRKIDSNSELTKIFNTLIQERANDIDAATAAATYIGANNVDPHLIYETDFVRFIEDGATPLEFINKRVSGITLFSSEHSKILIKLLLDKFSRNILVTNNPDYKTSTITTSGLIEFENRKSILEKTINHITIENKKYENK